MLGAATWVAAVSLVEMYSVVVFSYVIFNCLWTSNSLPQELSLAPRGNYEKKENQSFVNASDKNRSTVKKTQVPKLNTTYFEKRDNALRVPFSQNFEAYKHEKKIKKIPKRIIQKIIKRNRSRSRKLYLNQLTSPTTKSFGQSDNNMIKQKLSQRNEFVLTTKDPRQLSKIKKYSMQSAKNGYHNNVRSKRMVKRNDLFILKDFDEMEFLDGDKDYDVVKTHVKNYW